MNQLNDQQRRNLREDIASFKISPKRLKSNKGPSIDRARAEALTALRDGTEGVEPAVRAFTDALAIVTVAEAAASVPSNADIQHAIVGQTVAFIDHVDATLGQPPVSSQSAQNRDALRVELERLRIAKSRHAPPRPALEDDAARLRHDTAEMLKNKWGTLSSSTVYRNNPAKRQRVRLAELRTQNQSLLLSTDHAASEQARRNAGEMATVAARLVMAAPDYSSAAIEWRRLIEDNCRIAGIDPPSQEVKDAIQRLSAAAVTKPRKSSQPVSTQARPGPSTSALPEFSQAQSTIAPSSSSQIRPAPGSQGAPWPNPTGSLTEAFNPPHRAAPVPAEFSQAQSTIAPSSSSQMRPAPGSQGAPWPKPTGSLTEAFNPPHRAVPLPASSVQQQLMGGQAPASIPNTQPHQTSTRPLGNVSQQSNVLDPSTSLEYAAGQTAVRQGGAQSNPMGAQPPFAQHSSSYYAVPPTQLNYMWPHPMSTPVPAGVPGMQPHQTLANPYRPRPSGYGPPQMGGMAPSNTAQSAANPTASARSNQRTDDEVSASSNRTSSKRMRR